MMGNERRAARLAAVAAALALLMPTAVWAQEAVAPVQTITLEEAVDLAVRNSPVMVQRQGAVRTAQSAERSALGSFIPSLSFSTGASLASSERFDPNTNTTVSGSNDSYNARLSSSFDVFTAGRRGAQMQLTRVQTAAAEAGVVEQRFAVVRTAKQTFYEVLRAEETTRISEAQLERAQQGLEAAKRRLEVGSATRSDTLRTRLELTQAQQALLQAQTQWRAAMYSLGAVVGLEGQIGATGATAEGRPLALPRAEIVELAVSASPAVVLAESNLNASTASARVARTQYFPSVGVSGSYSWFNQDATLAGGRTSWSTGLSLSYPLFNGFSREDAQERASVNLTTSRVQLEDARRQARSNVERVLGSLELARQQVELAGISLAVAQEDLRVQDARYELAATTILDLIASQVAVAQAELSLVNARYDYELARAELEALVGRDL